MSTMLGFIALVAISSHLAPHVTRRDIFFGVTVSQAFREGPLARRVSRRYAVEVWLLAMAAAAIVVTSPMPFFQRFAAQGDLRPELFERPRAPARDKGLAASVSRNLTNDSKSNSS
jgi:hypothetical protein